MPAIVGADGHLAAVERDSMSRARSGVWLEVDALGESPLVARKRLLRYALAARGTTGIGFVDYLARRARSRGALDDELAIDAELDIEALYVRHSVADSPQSPMWPHTHGLREIGAFDFDALDLDEAFLGARLDTNRAIAFAVPEGKAGLGADFELARPDGTVALVPAEQFVQSAAPEHLALSRGDHYSNRLLFSPDEVEASLQLAIYDLAARQLWPWAKHVEIEFDMLRHGLVLKTSRTDNQREATREYILATIAQIESATDFPARPNTHCVHCDHRRQRWAYAEALLGKRRFVTVEGDAIEAIGQEREEVARLVKILTDRNDALDAVIKAQLATQDSIVAGTTKYAMGVTTRTEYAFAALVDALAVYFACAWLKDETKRGGET